MQWQTQSASIRPSLLCTRAAALAAGAPHDGSAPPPLPSQQAAASPGARLGLEALLRCLVAALRDRTAGGQPPGPRARGALLHWLALGEAGYQHLPERLPTQLVTYHQVGGLKLLAV